MELAVRREGVREECSCALYRQMRKILGRYDSQDGSDVSLDNEGCLNRRYFLSDKNPKSPFQSLNRFERLRFWSHAKLWRTFPYES